MPAQLLTHPAQAILALADGTVFRGSSIGAAGHTVGEVVFNTAMTGYQEILTDPSYCRQIVTLTYPHVGNYGISAEDIEASQVFAAGLIIKDLPLLASNFRSTMTLSDYLQRERTVAIADIDTRRLTRILRTHGAQNGCILAHCRTARPITQAHVDDAIAKAKSRAQHERPRPGQGGQRIRALRVDRDRMGARHRLRANSPTRPSTSSPSTTASSATSCACWRAAAAASPWCRRRPPPPRC